MAGERIASSHTVLAKPIFLKFHFGISKTFSDITSSSARVAPQLPMSKELVLTDHEISKRIYIIRGHRVMLDGDLADLYEVETKSLNRSVRRNIERFPGDFAFELTRDEWEVLRCQIGTLKLPGSGAHRKYLPFVFTEQGVAMLAGILSSPRAIQANIAIIRTFVRLRQMLESNKELSQKLSELETKYDRQFKAVFDAIREIMTERSVPRKQIIGIGRPD